MFAFESDVQEGHHSRWLSNLEDLSSFFTIIRKNSRVRDLGLAEALCSAMVERNWSLKSLDDLPVSLAIPIKEILKICQISPKMSYSLETYRLIDREDLFEFARGIASNFEAPEAESDSSVSFGIPRELPLVLTFFLDYFGWSDYRRSPPSKQWRFRDR